MLSRPRSRSTSPKSVSFSPVLERKYTADRGPNSPPPPHRPLHDALLADLQNSINPGGGPGERVRSPGGRPYSPIARSHSPAVRPVSPALRPVSPALRPVSPALRPVSPARSLSPPPLTPDRPRYSPSSSPSPSPSPGYGTLNGVRHIPQTRQTAGGLSELDLLLDDLSAATHTHGRGRPTVDSLLDQLSADLPRKDVSIREGPGSTPDKKTVTVVVRETSVTPAPPASPHVSPHMTHMSPHVTHVTHMSPNMTPVSGSHQYHSATTRHLDHLMNDLAHFKVAQESSLECMLGSLRADMSRQGVSTAQKGCCSACEKPIVGQVITALGRTWHPEHFTCAHCTQELGTRNFFERDGRPYCEPDYHNLFSPRCAYCNGPILDKCVTALEKTWHTEHFFCAQCGQQFGEEGFHEREGKPYCRDDYFDMFAPKCGGCVKPIMENYISALNAQWHPDCFVCRECGCEFVGGSFFTHEGVPYCETHYHGRRGSLCAGCHKPISGRCVTAMFRKFHPDHFVCAFCLKQLNKGTFKEHNDKPYCHTCFDKLFG